MWTKKIRSGLLAALAVGPGMCLLPARAQTDTGAPTIRRADLAQSATFTVTSELSPQGGSKVTQVFRVEVKGSKARLDYSDPAIGDVRYVANDKGIFLVMSANQTAVRQHVEGGVDQALQMVFAQANEQLKSARRTGTAMIAGIPTDVYKDAKTGTVIYVGKQPGFRLPIKTLLTNEGGSRTVTVSKIKTGVVLPDSHFALPAGVRIIDGDNSGPPASGRG